MLKLIKVILFCLSIGLVFGCTEDRVYEENYDLPESIWPIAEEVNFHFPIENTDQLYQVFLNIRHDADYPFRNIYIKYQLSDSTEYVMEDALANFKLFSDTEGKPFGKATSNIYSYQELLLDSLSFPHVGTYTFSMDQYMRQDSLPGLYSVGIKIIEQPTAAE